MATKSISFTDTVKSRRVVLAGAAALVALGTACGPKAEVAAGGWCRHEPHSDYVLEVGDVQCDDVTWHVDQDCVSARELELSASRNGGPGWDALGYAEDSQCTWYIHTPEGGTAQFVLGPLSSMVPADQFVRVP